MTDFTSAARDTSYTAGDRFSARPLFLLDQAGAIVTTQADEPLLTQAGHSGTSVSAGARSKAWSATDRETGYTATARPGWTSEAR